jgi:hypothetical protein
LWWWFAGVYQRRFGGSSAIFDLTTACRGSNGTTSSFDDWLWLGLAFTDDAAVLTAVTSLSIVRPQRER